MLSELEARLRVELAQATEAAKAEKNPEELRNPLIFWGYLVKNRFMAGELYGMSRALVEYVATTPSLKTMIRGAEDKQVSSTWLSSKLVTNSPPRPPNGFVYIPSLLAFDGALSTVGYMIIRERGPFIPMAISSRVNGCA